MGKSINPMCSLLQTQGEALAGSAPGLIVLMSLQPAIPWRVALLHCPPPLHRLVSVYHPPAESVNHHLVRAGEFSTGTMGNFQPVLTSASPELMGLAVKRFEDYWEKQS
jgi:hypothetical protein